MLCSMSNLPLKITHSLSFLNSTVGDISRIYQSSLSMMNELTDMDLDRDGAPGKMRKKTKDYRDEIDDNIQRMNEDLLIFFTDFNVILQHKHDETVIYTLGQYKKILDKYDDLLKEMIKFSKGLELVKDKCVSEQNYVRYIALNKISTPIFQLIQTQQRILQKLEFLTGEKSSALKKLKR